VTTPFVGREELTRLLQLNEGSRRLSGAGESKIGPSDPAQPVFRKNSRRDNAHLLERRFDKHLKARSNQQFQRGAVAGNARVRGAICAPMRRTRQEGQLSAWRRKFIRVASN